MVRNVYFYGTCLIDLWSPEAGMAAIQLLQREGVRVIFPPEQTCCGQPAFNSGFWPEAKKVAQKQISCFPKDYPILVPSGSCAAMMKHHYHDLFANDPFEEEARAFSARIHEWSEYLVNKLKIRLKDNGPPTRATWHVSCHALREMKVREEPRSLIQQLENVELIPLPRETECCGFGGTFAMKQAEISTAMVEDKSKAVVETNAEYLLAGDCGCLMNIAGNLEYQGEKVKVQHLAQFLWERTL